MALIGSRGEGGERVVVESRKHTTRADAPWPRRVMGNAGSSGRIGRADRQGHVISESPVGVSSKLHLKSTGERLTIDYVSTLPPEVGSHIVQYLFPEDIAILRLVCRRWRDFVDSEIVQQQLCAGVWPGQWCCSQSS